MGIDFQYRKGQTALDLAEIEGLRIDTISTRQELDEFEQQNIEEAIQWIIGKSFKIDQILTEPFIRQLHKRMYAAVWSWAGNFRKTEKNLGIQAYRLGPELKYLLEDCLYWIANKTFPADEIALRFKHRLVGIHCFPNGNGRHSRLMADLIIEKIYTQPVFTWGSSNLVEQGHARAKYLASLRAADAGNIKPLIVFART